MHGISRLDSTERKINELKGTATETVQNERVKTKRNMKSIGKL